MMQLGGFDRARSVKGTLAGSSLLTVIPALNVLTEIAEREVGLP
jgi:hypothetical protein